MAISAQFTISTAATTIISAPPGLPAGPSGWFYITNSATQPIYLGGSAVTSNNGAQVAASATLSGYVWPNSNIYACTSTGTSVVGILVTGAVGV